MGQGRQQPMIRGRGLQARYPGAAPLVFGDLDVPAGGVLLLQGPSGSGKSTLLALLAALMAPSAGTLEVAGVALQGLSASAADRWRARHIGFLPQQLHLSPALTVRHNLELALWAAGHGADALRIDSALKSLGVESLASRRAASLSGGQAQRVALARALLMKPPVLLADEPTASLDDDAAVAAMGLLLDAAVQNQSTLVIATHDARVAGHLDAAPLACGWQRMAMMSTAQVVLETD